jgi:hypothetical protein
MPDRFFIQTLVHSGNVRVAIDDSPVERSESVVAIDPANPLRRVVASKYFPNLINNRTRRPRDRHSSYKSWLATAFSEDGGKTWHNGGFPPQLSDWSRCTDPGLMFDDQYVYLIGNPRLKDNVTWSVCVYRSADLGANWEQPVVFHKDVSDDKTVCASDNISDSSFRNRLYAAWDIEVDGVQRIAFSKSVDQGATWQGTDSGTDHALLPGHGNYATIVVSDKGHIHIFSLSAPETEGSSKILMYSSDNGGDSFTGPVEAASGFNSTFGPLTAGLPFRVYGMPTACATLYGLAIAWTVLTPNGLRVRSRVFKDGKWRGPPDGEVLPNYDNHFLPIPIPDPPQHTFMPQLASLPDGQVGCMVSRVDPLSGSSRVTTVVYVADSGAENLADSRAVTLADWDPEKGLIHDDQKPYEGFIGDYNGFAGAGREFQAIWTDTREGGRQQLYGDRIHARSNAVEIDPSDRLRILFGITQDGAGIGIRPDGTIDRIGPRSPMAERLRSLRETFESRPTERG